ncbi:MAG: hypothetical protein M1832_004522 [Thelocarpon impressellum]|nr:MAG: hypothetical protein M1832_004522 [Thelocarpon impressellum]
MALSQPLLRLDDQLEKSKNIRKSGPVKLIAAGGFLRNQKKIKEKFQHAVRRANKKYGYDEDWINYHVEVFAVRDVRKRLCRDSIEQNVVL